MIFISLFGVAMAAGDPAPPSVFVDWKKDRGSLRVAAAAGTYIQETGPVSGWWELGPTRTEVHSSGAQLVDGGLALDLPATQRGLRGELRLPVCDEGGTACRLVDVGFLGALSGKKGRGHPLAPWTPVDKTPTAAPHTGVDEAFARAKSDGKLVLIDFGAVWCPPCNRLAAEVLEDPADAAALSPFAVATVDVDRQESWPVKSRYEVGGYPTVVVTDADGHELDRMVGYPDEAAFLAWLGGVAEVTPLSALPAADDVSGEEAAAIAQRLARLGLDDRAGPYIAAAGESDTLDLIEARFLVEPSTVDLARLLDGQASGLLHWIWGVVGLELEPSLRDAVIERISGELGSADPVVLADLIYVVGRLSEGPAAEAAFASAARTLELSLSGDPALDRGHWTFLARLWERGGQVDRAEAVLAAAIVAYPDEFTFHFALARQQLRLEQDAVAVAQQALTHAYGDNALRAAEVVARALAAQDRTVEALALIDETLASATVPGEDTKVRTPRYLNALKDARVELAAE